MTTSLDRVVLEYESNISKNEPVIPHEATSNFTVCNKHNRYYRVDSECNECLREECLTETGKKNNQLQGMKFDEDKLRWDLLPYDAVEKIVEIITHGAKKYAPENWKKVDEQRYIGALMRHLVAYISGEDYDKDSGFSHLSHVGCNVLFLIWLFENKVKHYPEKGNGM